MLRLSIICIEMLYISGSEVSTRVTNCVSTFFSFAKDLTSVSKHFLSLLSTFDKSNSVFTVSDDLFLFFFLLFLFLFWRQTSIVTVPSAKLTVISLMLLFVVEIWIKSCNVIDGNPEIRIIYRLGYLVLVLNRRSLAIQPSIEEIYCIVFSTNAVSATLSAI